MGVIFEAEFDDCPDTPCKVELVEDGVKMAINLVAQAEAVELLCTTRDQWGVFVGIGETTIQQEDGTRSFLDALIRALIVLRKCCEVGTLPATVTVDGYPSTETDIAHITDIPF